MRQGQSISYPANISKQGKTHRMFGTMADIGSRNTAKKRCNPRQKQRQRRNDRTRSIYPPHPTNKYKNTNQSVALDKLPITILL